MSDLKNAFNWNSKVLFLYIVAEYASKTAVRFAADSSIDSRFSNIYFVLCLQPLNQVVVWDKIVSPDQGSLRISNELVKYALIDNGANLRCVVAVIVDS
jgi:hypothetical protein